MLLMFWNQLPTKAGKAYHCCTLFGYMRHYAKIDVILRFSLADIIDWYGDYCGHIPEATTAARALKTFCAGK